MGLPLIGGGLVPARRAFSTQSHSLDSSPFMKDISGSSVSRTVPRAAVLATSVMDLTLTLGLRNNVIFKVRVAGLSGVRCIPFSGLIIPFSRLQGCQIRHTLHLRLVILFPHKWGSWWGCVGWSFFGSINPNPAYHLRKILKTEPMWPPLFSDTVT